MVSYALRKYWSVANIERRLPFSKPQALWERIDRRVRVVSHLKRQVARACNTRVKRINTPVSESFGHKARTGPAPPLPVYELGVLRRPSAISCPETATYLSRPCPRARAHHVAAIGMHAEVCTARLSRVQAGRPAGGGQHAQLVGVRPRQNLHLSGGRTQASLLAADVYHPITLHTHTTSWAACHPD